MTDENEIKQVSVEEARVALGEVETMEMKGKRMGVPSFCFSVGVSLWAGALAATAGTGWLLLVLFVGMVGLFQQKQRRKAGILEVSGAGDVKRVVVMGLLLGAMFLCGWIGYDMGYRWAPYVAGAVVAVSQFYLMERTYGPLRQMGEEGEA